MSLQLSKYLDILKNVKNERAVEPSQISQFSVNANLNFFPMAWLVCVVNALRTSNKRVKNQLEHQYIGTYLLLSVPLK